MRRFLSAIPLLVLTAGVALAGEDPIVVVQPFNNVACLVNSTNYSAALDLDAYRPASFEYALQLLVTNATATNTAGEATVSYELSNDNRNYLSSSNIVSSLSFTNSPTSGGHGFYQFTAGKSRYIRFKVITAETNCWVSGWLAIQ